MNPSDTPPGVTVRLLPRPSGVEWTKWLQDNPAPATVATARPKMKPRLLLVHTNGANGTGTAASAFNWSMAKPSNTKAHYQVDMDGSAVKFLPSDRTGIANYLAAPFSIAIETADPGWGPGKPGTNGAFTAAQVETIARIIAFESEMWDFPIEFPTAWNGAGVASHTEPFGYPYWTNSKGKPCPGLVKKQQMINEIMPRARVIRYGKPPPEKPTPQPVQEDEDMKYWIAAPGRPEGLMTIDSAGIAFVLTDDVEIAADIQTMPGVARFNASAKVFDFFWARRKPG